MHEKTLYAVGGVLIATGLGGVITGAASVSFGLGLATQVIAGVAVTDFLILGGTILTAIGGGFIGMHSYSGMLGWAAIWAAVFSVTVSTFSTAVLYQSMYTQAGIWFLVTAGATQSLLGISNYLVNPKDRAERSLGQITLCAVTMGVFSAIAATALPLFTQTFINEPAFMLLVNFFSTAILAEILVVLTAARHESKDCSFINILSF